MKRNLSILLVLLTVFMSVFFSTGCENQAENNTIKSDKVSIVTTIFPYYDFVKNIAGDKADIKLLLSPGNEPHNYEPSPSDIVAIENCDIFIYNGGESDEWVESMLSSLENDEMKQLKMK